MAADGGRPGIRLAWNYVDLDASARLLTVGQALTLLSFEGLGARAGSIGEPVRTLKTP